MAGRTVGALELSVLSLCVCVYVLFCIYSVHWTSLEVGLIIRVSYMFGRWWWWTKTHWITQNLKCTNHTHIHCHTWYVQHEVLSTPRHYARCINFESSKHFKNCFNSKTQICGRIRGYFVIHLGNINNYYPKQIAACSLNQWNSKTTFSIFRACTSHMMLHDRISMNTYNFYWINTFSLFSYE